MNVEKNPELLRELGNKLANFRKKLALAIGQKKITQPEFGEMFGGQTPRMMTSFERGEVDPPASMLYLIWKSGNSVDGIFGEEPINDRGREAGRELYARCSLATLKRMDKTAQDRLMREVGNDKRFQGGPAKETAPKTSGKRKTSNGKTRAAKRH
jgi:hypothetical protein